MRGAGRLASCVIFDLDGTLVDSAPGIASALNVIRTTPEPVGVERVRALVSRGAADLIRGTLGLEEAAVPEALAAFREVYGREPCRPDDLYPGADDLLRSLRAAGLSIGVCTNKPQGLAEIVIGRCGLGDRVDLVVGSSTERPSKPDPGMLRWLLGRLRAGGEAVLIGDSDVDAETAARAGVAFIAARYGYGPILGQFPSVAGIDALGDLVPILLDGRAAVE